MTQPILVFKVALAGRKSVWRRIALRGTQTLDDLHQAIFDAFDRYDEHLYSFYFPLATSKSLAKIREGEEYTCRHALEGPWGDEGNAKSTDAKLASLGLTPKRKFYYLFDFGDEWWHEITVEKTDAPAEKGKYPRVLETRGASPPQYPDADEDEDDWEGDEDA